MTIYYHSNYINCVFCASQILPLILTEFPREKTLDKTIKQHGQEFCEFLIDAKMCVLNGIFDPTSNCYTSVSGRGSSVVDYICVPHDVFSSCKSFTVIPSNSLVEIHNLQNLLGNRSKVPV